MQRTALRRRARLRRAGVRALNDSPDIIFYLAALILPLSALLARRVPLASTAKMAFGWIAIFAVGLVIVGQRERWQPLYEGGVRTLTGEEQQVSGDTVRIALSPDGHFWATGTINGVRRRMLIDSGASVTALSVATARAARIDIDSAPFGTLLKTANGPVAASRAQLGELRIGAISAHDLAVVVSPSFGDTDVIGMNFLSQLRGWRVEGRTLILEPETSH